MAVDAHAECCRTHSTRQSLAHSITHVLAQVPDPLLVPISPVAQVVVTGVPFVDLMNTMCDPTIPLTSGEWFEWGNPNEVSRFGTVRDSHTESTREFPPSIKFEFASESSPSPPHSFPGQVL